MYVIASTSYFSLYMKQVFQLYYYMYYILWLNPQDIWNLNQFCCILQTRSYVYSIISHDMLIRSLACTVKGLSTTNVTIFKHCAFLWKNQ